MEFFARNGYQTPNSIDRLPWLFILSSLKESERLGLVGPEREDTL